MNLKILVIKVLLLICVATAVQFNWNTLNATNKSLDELNQNKITLNSTKDEHYNDAIDHYVNDGNVIIDNNDDPIMTWKIRQQEQQLQQQQYLDLMFKEKLKSLLKVTTMAIARTTTNSSINNKKNEKLINTSTTAQLPFNFNNENKCQHIVSNNDEPNKTNHDNEAAIANAVATLQLNNKLKNNFKYMKEETDVVKEKAVEEGLLPRTPESIMATNTTAIFNDKHETEENVEQTLNDFEESVAKKKAQRERVIEGGGVEEEEANVYNFKGEEYQMKYYAAPMYSLSNTAFLLGQLPQLLLQPQQMQLFPQQQMQQQQQQQTATLSSSLLPLPPQEYHHLADYRFLFNPERHTEFFLHTLSTTTKRQQQQQRIYDASVANEAAGELTTTTTETSYDTTSLPSHKENDDDNDNDTDYHDLNGRNDDNLGVAMNLSDARFLNVVTDTIGAAFGVNTRPVAGIHGINTEEIELHNGLSLRQSRFNPYNPCRILIHGWLGGSNAGIYNTLVPEYFKLQDGSYNIITVDWSKAAIADYITASYRVKPVGMVVAKFIDFLHRETGIPFENIHVIGFSMGAHIAGIAGKFIQTGRLPVIYGLDPALPLFRYENINERLDIADADYVEVIHTSVGSYGYDHPLGHVDFYVNYGYNQPGCFFNECSHFRAFQVYAQSLSNEFLEGMECFSELWLDMIKFKRCIKEMGKMLSIGVEGLTRGQLASRRGLYFVNTNAQPPYKMG